MDNLNGCIVSEETKKLLTKVKDRIKAILKHSEICEDDIGTMINDLAFIRLLEK